MLQVLLNYVVLFLEIVGITIILMGVFKAIFTILHCIYKRIRISSVMTEIRIELSNYLVLSLEIIIGRDIIETFLAPSVEDIIILVVLVLLRTLLAFFLNFEMRHAPRKKLHKELQKQ